jgi:hypothetical protein
MTAPASAICNAPRPDPVSTPDAPAGARFSLSALRQAAQQATTQDLTPAERLARLERLRTQALVVPMQQRTNYLGQPLPLSDEERIAWEEQVGLWQALYLGFALCADIGDPERAAAVWVYALDSVRRALREYGRVYRAAPPVLWKELNSCYRTAEACGLDLTPALTGDAPDTASTCRQIALTALLHDAANLAALSGAEMQVLEGWLPRWVRHADLLADVPSQAGRSPLAVQLDGNTGARLARDLPQDASLRFLDTSRLGTELRRLATAVREQRADADLDLALRVLARPEVERLLTHLYVQWCSSGTGRHELRDTSSTPAQVATHMHAIHFQVSGRAFRQPGMRYTREEEHDLATFGHITERTERRLLTTRSAALEPWEIVNRGSGGSLGMRRGPDLQSRIAFGQLVAVRTSSALPPMLGVVQRMRMESDGTLGAGVRVIADAARGVAVRRIAAPAPDFERALLLPVDEGRRLPESIVAPLGRFQPGTVLELHDKRTDKILLGQVVERGSGFERLTCERL